MQLNMTMGKFDWLLMLCIKIAWLDFSDITKLNQQVDKLMLFQINKLSAGGEPMGKIIIQ